MRDSLTLASYPFGPKIVDGQDIKAFERLLKAHRDVMAHIARRSSEDQAYDVSLRGLCPDGQNVDSIF